MGLRAATLLCAAAVTTAMPAAQLPVGHSVALSSHHTTGVPTVLRQSAATNGSAFPTGGNVWPVAIYWITIQVGTPPKPFPVAIDSGSMTLDIQGPGCANCPKFAPNNEYIPAASSTSKPCNVLTCHTGKTFSNSYQTCDLANPDAVCTIKGNNYKDMVSIGSLGPVPVTFGAVTSQTSNFDQFKQIDGVVGLAGGAGESNVFESLRKGGFIGADMFGMCLHKGTTSNGTFTVGGLDSRLYTGQFQWAKNVGAGLYEMPLAGITVNGKAVACSRKTAILDSGTNVLLVPTPIYTSITAELSAMCAAGAKLKGVCNTPAGSKSLFKDGCFDMDESDIAAFPNITLGITAGGLNMPPSTYLRAGDPRSKGSTKLCFGIRDTGASGFLIIGDTTMENYYVAFDRAQGRIGWAQRTDLCGSV